MKEKRNALIILHLLLMGFWLIIASRIDWFEVIIGFIVSSFIVIYNYDLVFERKDATRITLRSIVALFVLFFVLIYEIFKANLQVAKVVLNPKLPINPHFVKIKQPLKKDLNRALYGNSITLTPGTLTVGIDEDWIIVHALTKDAAKELEGNRIQKAFVAFEGEKE